MEDNKKEPGGERPETLDGIVVDILDRAVVADRHGARETSNESVAALLRDIANRIKAAAKRERETADLRAIHAAEMAERDTRRELAPGSTAALREALDGMLKASQEVFRRFARGVFAGERRLDSLEIAYDKAKAALAAPARNCDKYGIDDVKEMDADFKAFCRRFGAKDGENCVGCPIKPMDNLCCHSAWMLLPAEGGAEC